MNSARTLYAVDGLPIFQNRMYDSRDAARNCPRGNVKLVEDLETGLVYNQSFQPDLLEYDANYQNEQGVSPFFLQHLESIADLVERTMGRERLVEVGCGKGLFLELLASKGFDIGGFDPTYEGTNPRVVKEYFHANLGIKGDGLILRHVLEHIQDPVDFLHQLRETNGGGGKIYIEVPCFDWICQHRAWFDIFYEHVNYFRLSDFERMFGTLYSAGRSFDGQYLSVVADLGSLRPPRIDAADKVQFPADFTKSLTPRDLKHSAVWGGASKGVLFSLMMERAGAAVELVIDINPAKQGRFLPATGLQVFSPQDGVARLAEGATIYVMNGNYLPEIREMSRNRFNYVRLDDE